ncbi:MAG: HTH domain-containing protein [Marinilabiliales bacterium]|nr:HTH domain-containing protein [Marinilabiliales bacterium]
MVLLLRDGRPVSAASLARRFEVSVRTIYRDIESLGMQGVPVIAEMGRAGGFKLRDGYFLPPVSLCMEEATTLLLGLLLLKRLRVVPFPDEAENAERKLMAVLPAATQDRASRAAKFIGFEQVPADLLHREPNDLRSRDPASVTAEGASVGLFLRALLERSRLRLRYGAAGEGAYMDVEPCAILWDRDRWYLAGRKGGDGGEVRLWRADRVVDLRRGTSMHPTRDDYDVAELLERKWMREAMKSWTRAASRPHRPQRRPSRTLEEGLVLRNRGIHRGRRRQDPHDLRGKLSRDAPWSSSAGSVRARNSWSLSNGGPWWPPTCG